MIDENFYCININAPIDKKDLISEIKSLQKVSTPNVEKETDSTKKPFLLSDLSKKKKKKDKNKKIGIELLCDGEIKEFTKNNRHNEENETYNPVNITSIADLLDEDDEEEPACIDLDIVGEQCSNYDKLKKEENMYKKEFAEEITLLYNLLKETTKFGKDLQETYDYLSKTKVRGVNKYTIELADAILNSKSSKLQIIKEIASIKKTIQDLKLKSDTKNKDQSQGSTEAMAAHYFNNILNYGRSNFIKDLTNGKKVSDDEDDGTVDPRDLMINTSPYTGGDFNTDRFMDMIEERLESTENPFRSEEGSKYIEYENLGVKIKIKKCVDTGEWDFVAIDRNGMQIYDYPLPRKADCGKMKFSPDGSYGTDAQGRTYDVIEYYLPEDQV